MGFIANIANSKFDLLRYRILEVWRQSIIAFVPKVGDPGFA
jgi:hypothetical protein